MSNKLLNKLDKTDLLIIIGLLFTAFIISCSSSLNPFALNSITEDISVYLTVARGITEGQVPFRDFFDNKGPLLYLISAAGMLFNGFTGVWLVGLFFMCVSVFFAYKTALFFGGKFSAFWGVVFSFILFRMNYYDLEYSIPFMIISLYIFTKHYFTPADQTHPQTEPSILELIILGVCFAASILIRINMFSLWLGFCIVIAVESIKNRNYLSLFKYIAWFVAGILIVFIPIMLYLYLNNALSDYISQNLLAGGTRGLEGISILRIIWSFLVLSSRNFSFIPLIMGILWILKSKGTRHQYFYIGFTLSFFFSVFFYAIIGTSFDHYNMSFVPFLVPVIAYFTQKVLCYFSAVKYSKLAALIFLCVIFHAEIRDGLYNTGLKLTSRSRNDIIALGRIIDQNTKDGDEIIALGRLRQIYLFTSRRPASKYIYQLSGAQYYSNTIPEFLSDMENKKPALILLSKGGRSNLPQWYAPVFEMIENEYDDLLLSDDYYLFKRRS